MDNRAAALVALVQQATADDDVSLHLQVRLRAAADELATRETEEDGDASHAFLDLAARTLEGSERGAAALRRLQQRCVRYLTHVADSTRRLAALGCDVLVTAMRADPSGGGGSCVLTHGHSRYVTALLLSMAKRTHVTVLIAEDRPDGSGHRTAAELLAAGLPVRMVEFGAAARCMATVQLVLCGAHAVLADGGVLGRVGTLTLAHAAHAHSRPLYVAAPHHAFCHTRHLDATAQSAVRGVPAPSHRRIMLERPGRDATPAQLVTLLLTDVGVLTTSAVADEMTVRHASVCGSR
jgi:methylthioribose-1-phosphate isomerase